MRASVGGLRLANLLLTAAAAWIALGAVGRLVKDERDAMVIGLAIATQPLFLINGVRVANDALGVLLATLAIVAGLELDGRRLVRESAAVGVLVGLAIAVKAVHFGLVPFAGACWLMAAVLGGGPKSRGRAALAAAAMAAGCAVVILPEVGWNLAHYGLPSPMQEAVKNRADGRTGLDLIAAARRLDWPARLSDLWLRGSLLTGGWSFLGASHRWARRYRDLVVLGLIGWAWAAIGRGRSPFRSARVPAGCVVLGLGYSAALAYHMAQSQLAWGTPTTNPWYACAALPWFVALVAGGVLAWPWPAGRARVALPILLAATFVVTEGIAIWGGMVATYSGGAGGMEALRRLARLQPAWLGTATLLAAQAGALILFAAIIPKGIRSTTKAPRSQRY